MKVLITGAGGMLGSSFCRSWIKNRPNDRVIDISRKDADLSNKTAVSELFELHKPDLVIHTAAHVDGISAKLRHPTEYLLENLVIDTNVISAALENYVSQFIYVSSAAVYPEKALQPLSIGSILDGQLEAVNEGYALAKICGTKLCEFISREYGYQYRALILSNLYGPGDYFDEKNGHLIAAALKKVEKAKLHNLDEVEIWGDGRSRREFTFSDDVTQWVACNFQLFSSLPPVINIGAGQDYSIDDFYETAKNIVGYTGKFVHDTTKPSGMRQRLLDSSVAKGFGWEATTSLFDGMTATYNSMISREN